MHVYIWLSSCVLFCLCACLTTSVYSCACVFGNTDMTPCVKTQVVPRISQKQLMIVTVPKNVLPGTQVIVVTPAKKRYLVRKHVCECLCFFTFVADIGCHSK